MGCFDSLVKFSFTKGKLRLSLLDGLLGVCLQFLFATLRCGFEFCLSLFDVPFELLPLLSEIRFELPLLFCQRLLASGGGRIGF